MVFYDDSLFFDQYLAYGTLKFEWVDVTLHIYFGNLVDELFYLLLIRYLDT